MRSYWSDPYLWLHLAGLAVLPLWLEVGLLGLAVGDPVLPVWLELGLVGSVGILPILWMQLQRPFCIFSLVAVVVKPTQLTADQRKLLTLFKSGRTQVLAIATAVLMAIVLRQLYVYAPIATEITPFNFESRWLGLLVAAVAFLFANLFIQVPVSVLSVLLTSDTAFAATVPYPPDQVRPNFTLLGLPLNQILPPIQIEAPPQVAPVAPAPVADAAASLSEDPWAEAEAEPESPVAVPEGEGPLAAAPAGSSEAMPDRAGGLTTDSTSVSESPEEPETVAQPAVPSAAEDEAVMVVRPEAETVDVVIDVAIAPETTATNQANPDQANPDQADLDPAKADQTDGPGAIGVEPGPIEPVEELDTAEISEAGSHDKTDDSSSA